ncbi:MAG: riboflavin biosynthesis protein RibF [Prevotellaceae bacterium]|jgi:riboflavin kinase/FMN adenylyltransferase|nr:riboflavin biosynthesis protein RibF [Prevotellaceae bacterium]
MVRYIATTGFFDGVHRGHITVLERLLEVGKSFNLPVAVITFWPHPRTVLNSTVGKFGLLSSIDEKKRRIEKTGINRIIVIPFTEEFSKVSPEQFIVNELVEKYGIAGLCIGYDHHVGRNGAAGYDEIKKICNRTGVYCERIKPFILPDGITASSEKIRRYICENRIEEANSMLGYSYSLTGTVVHGNRFGRTIGFPTANIAVNDPFKIIPADGVYAVKVKIDNYSEMFSGMLFAGTKMHASEKTLEVHIFDFEQDIYAKKVEVHFEKFVRKNLKFETGSEIKIQLEQDRYDIKKLQSLKN